MKNLFVALSRPLLAATVLLAAQAPLSLSAQDAGSQAVTGFNDRGWNADDVRNTSGTNIVNATTHAPASGATLDADTVATRLDWAQQAGSFGNLGGLRINSTTSASGKATISVADASAGFGQADDVFTADDFGVIYRWQRDSAAAAGLLFRMGLQTASFATSTQGFTAQRSGEGDWDLILVYDPTNNGNSSGTTLTTTAIDLTTGKFNLFAQAGNTYWSNQPGAAKLGISAANSRTLAAWLADADWGARIASALIVNTQFGLGSGNANAVSVLDWTQVSYLADAARTDFVEAARYTGPGTAFADAANWGGTTPSSTQNLIVEQDATLTVTGTQNTRSLGILAGTTNLTLHNASTLVLNAAENGTLSAAAGATLAVAGPGTLQASVIEAGGTISLATTTQLDGGATPHPVRDGGPSATSRYGLVVLDGGTVNLAAGANVTMTNDTGVNGLKTLIRVGEVSGAARPGVLNIADGAQLSAGSLHGTGSWSALHVGDWGGHGEVNQTGGDVDLFGALVIGNEGGIGTYNLEGGTIDIRRPVGDNASVIVGRATSSRTASGTLNISGGTLTLGATGGANGNVAMVVGGLSDNVAAYANATGTVNQTGGTVRFENAILKFGRGTGAYNLNGGTLEIGGTQGISVTPGGTASFNLGGGTLKVIGQDLKAGVAFTLIDGTSSTIDTNGFNATLNAGISGAFSSTGGDLHKAGDGTLILAGGSAAVYAGGDLKVDGGTIRQDSGTAQFYYGSIGADGNTGAYVLNGGSFNARELNVGDFGGTGTFTQNGGSVQVATDRAINIGNRGGTGTYAINAGQLQFNATVNLLGRHAVNDGALVPSSHGTLAISGTAVVDLATGGALILGSQVETPNAAAIATGSTGTINQTGGTFRVNAGAGLYLSAVGSGSYNLSGGTLEIGGDSLIAHYGTTTGSTHAFNLGGGTVKVIGSALTTNLRPTLVANTTSTIDTGSLGATFTQGLAGTGGFNKTGTGALTLNGTTDLAAASDVRGLLRVGAGSGKSGTLNLASALTLTVVGAEVGRLQIGVDGGTGSAVFASGASFTNNDSAKTTGWGTLDVGRGTGSTGTLDHTSGRVSLSSGALQIGYSSGHGTYQLRGTGELTLGATSSLFIGSGANARGLLTIGDGASFTSAGQAFIGAGSGAVGTITQTGGTARFTGTAVGLGADSDETTNAPGSGTYNLSGGTLTFDHLTGSYGVKIGDSGGGSGALNQSDGTLAVLGTTLRVGTHGAFTQSGGLLQIGGTNLTGAGAYTFGGGTLQVTGTALATGMNATLASGKILTVDTNGLGATFSGALSGSGGLTKTGTGTLTLSGTNAYTGATAIEAGTLRVTGSLAASDMTTIHAGATLTGNGTIGALTVAAGGILAPGNSPGTLTVGDTIFAGGGTYLWQIQDASGSSGLVWDQLTIDGSLTLNATAETPFHIVLQSLSAGDTPGALANFDATRDHAYTLATISGNVIGFDADAFAFDLDAHGFANDLLGGAWSLSLTDGNLRLSFAAAAVPEPSTYAVIGGLLALLAALRRRRAR